MRSLTSRVERLERDAPGEWDLQAVLALFMACLEVDERQRQGQQVDPGDFPNIPPADDPFWGGLDNPLGQLYRDLCLTTVPGQGGTQEASE